MGGRRERADEEEEESIAGRADEGKNGQTGVVISYVSSRRRCVSCELYLKSLKLLWFLLMQEGSFFTLGYFFQSV